MKDSFLKGLLATVAVVLLSAVPASAGTFAAYGTWWDTDDAGDAAGIGLSYAWDLGEVVDLEARAAWYEELTDKPLDDFFSGDSPIETGLTVIPVELGLRFNFMRDSTFWNPWVGAGLAYYALDTDTGNVDDEIGFYATLGSTFGDGKGAVEDNNRAGEVIRRIRALVKKGDLEFSPLDLASLIRDVVSLVHSDAILHNFKISCELDDNLPPLRGDKVQLQQVVLNLILNAFDAMKDCPAGERRVVLRLELSGKATIRAAVIDRGTGLSGDKLDKIFQPFFTTKGEGLGMGLSICRSIIESHGGDLWAENNPGRGATFFFTLPVAQSDEGRASSRDE